MFDQERINKTFVKDGFQILEDGSVYLLPKYRFALNDIIEETSTFPIIFLSNNNGFKTSGIMMKDLLKMIHYHFEKLQDRKKSDQLKLAIDNLSEIIKTL